MDNDPYIYEYGAPAMGSAEPNSSMIGRHKKMAIVAMKREIGELIGEYLVGDA